MNDSHPLLWITSRGPVSCGGFSGADDRSVHPVGDLVGESN